MLICFGTRPEYIKVKPLIEYFKSKIPFKILFTGQHKDLLNEIPDCIELHIQSGDNRLDSIVCSVLNNNQLFEGITSVLVQGDTTSAFSLALAAFHRKIKIFHLEAGLRTYDKSQPYPEEFNRRAISAMADIHFCPTQLTVDNLLREGFKEDIYLVGNSVLDNLVNIETEYGNKIFITLHRRENHHIMDKWFETIDRIAEKNPQYEFILPIHPNPEVRKNRNILKYVNVVEPIEYEPFIKELAKCRLVITDSGGIQEEASFFGKKCLVCRNSTERSEGIGVFSTLVNLENIHSVFDKEIKDFKIDEPCPYGDGKTSERIYDIIKNHI
jgi:UDP-N-acetylglucosamine 2-epimerase (non-hydrolysing)